MGQEMLAAGLAHGRITLKNAAEAINALHDDAIRHCKAGLISARDAGKLLAEAKKHIKHGAFMAWVTETCDFSPDTAGKYMRLYENWDSLVEAVGSEIPGMTIAEGIKKISQITKEKQDKWAKTGAKTGQQEVPNGGSKQGNCIKGGDHVWEADPELEGEFCHNCHEPKPADAPANDHDADTDPPCAGAEPEGDPAKRLDAKRLADLHKRITEMLGAALGLVDEYHRANPNEEKKNQVQDSIRIAYEDMRRWPNPQ